jgi:hypothetical protein
MIDYMKRLVTFALVISLILIFLMLLVRYFGQINPSAVILAPAGCQSQPCWHGIVPGQTKLTDAVYRLNAEHDVIFNTGVCSTNWSTPLWEGCLQSRDSVTVNRVMLEPHAESHYVLGQAIAHFGVPVAVSGCWIQLDRNTGAQQWNVLLYFRENINILFSFPDKMSRFSPESDVTAIEYFYADVEPPLPFDSPPWKGFHPLAAYRFDGC